MFYSVTIICVLIQLLQLAKADFDITTIYRLNEEGTENNVAEIQARNNAFGLPFLAEDKTVLYPNVGTDIRPCSALYEACDWEIANFTSVSAETPLILKGNTTQVPDISNAAVYSGSISFSFYASSEREDLRVYLMEDRKYLPSQNVYYFTGDGNTYSVWKCSSNGHNSQVQLVPNSDYRWCSQIRHEGFPYSDWDRDWYKFKVDFRNGYLQISVVQTRFTRMLCDWYDSDFLEIKYYAIGNQGSVKMEVDDQIDQISLALDKTSGSIISPPFIPSHSKVCISVIYEKILAAELGLNILKTDDKKLDFKHIQTTSLVKNWTRGVYIANLEDDNTRGPVQVQLFAEAPVEEHFYTVAIQLVAGCNSEDFVDVYVVPTQVLSESEDMNSYGYGYDVAVTSAVSNRTEEEVDCVNGGKFITQRDSCICPAGFTGENCETGCGPDLYGRNCDAHCTKTDKGCREIQLCRPHLGCNCAPGLKGILCNISCSAGEYGAGCKENCGQCSSGMCDTYTGKCSSGCLDGFYPPLCITSYKYLSVGPEVDSINYHTLKVTFDMNSENTEGRGNPKFYQIQIKDERTDLYKELEPYIITSENVIEKNITDLNPGIKYYVRVVLLDEDGNSYQGTNIPVSNAVTECDVPTTDYKLRAMEVNETGFKIEWEFSSSNPLWCEVNYFEVEQKYDWKWRLHYKGNTTTLTFSNLLPGIEYKVRVRGVTVGGPMKFSEPLLVSTKVVAPKAVSSLKVMSKTPDMLELKWSPPLATRGDISYRVSYKCQKLLACPEDCSFSEGEIEVSKESIVLRDLLPHAQYKIGVAAKKVLYGNLTYIWAVTDMTVPGIPPSSSDLSVTARTNSSLTVAWKAPENCTQLNGYLYGYEYELVRSRHSTPLSQGSTKLLKATFNYLSPRTKYNVRVYLKTSSGINFHKPLVIEASTSATVPSKVEDLTVYKTGRFIIGLRWALPKETYGDLRSFTISYKTPSGPMSRSLVKPIPCNAWPYLYCHTLTGLQPDANYKIFVQARNQEVAEDGEPAEIKATTKENAPEAPAYIKTLSQTETELTIEWGLPKLINGVLRSFIVNVEETDSYNITDCCQKFPLQQVSVHLEQPSYKIQLRDLHPTSTYAISITAKTAALGPAVTLTAHTRPSIPVMNGMIDIEDSEESISRNPTITIHPSSKKKDLISGYLVLVIPKSPEVTIEETPIRNLWIEQELQQYINGSYYVAAELSQEDAEKNGVVILGNGNTLMNGKWSRLWNPLLETGRKYRIGLIMIINYCGVYNIGYTETDTLTVETSSREGY